MPTGRADAFSIPVGGSVYAGIGPAIAPPSTATLSGPTSATSGGAVTYTVTLDRAADQTYTITPTASDSGSVSAPTVTIPVGQSSATFGATWPAAGTDRTVDFTIGPALTRAGRPITVSVTAPVAGGTWQRLSVAPHSRRVISESPATGTTFDPSLAITVDARAPTAVSAIPWRSFCRPVMGEPGILYYNGSQHSNYPGNEIDRIDLRDLGSTTITTTISHQPRIAPQGPDSGYGSGSGAYLYSMYGTPLADTSLWQPYAHHTWTKNGWHPTWGWFSQITYAEGDGATVGPNPAGAGTAYQVSNGYQGLVSYNFSEGKFHARVPAAQGPNFQMQGPGISGMADWNQHRMSLLALASYGGYTYLSEVVNNDSSRTDLFNFDQAAASGNTWGWADATSGNGLLVKHLEGSRYLLLRADFNKYSGDPIALQSFTTILHINLAASTNKVARITPPAAAVSGITPVGDGNIVFCVDKQSRRVFWLVFEANPLANATQFVRIYVSYFDSLETWTEINTTGLPTITNTTYQASWLASKREPMWFYNGHLFIILPEGGGANNPGYTNGAIDVYRVKVDAGEALPTMNFNRLDYWAQSPGTSGFRFSNTGTANLQLIGTKHVNWAYDPVGDKYYQMAGDFGMSTCQSMATLVWDGTARGYTFTEILDETTNPPAGKVRPSSPDDSYWFYVPTDSAWVEGRGKFVFVRGGDGEPMFYNAELRKKYGSSSGDGTITQVQNALNDGWSIGDKLYLFDQATATFTVVGPTKSFDTSACTPPSAAGSTYPVANYNGWTQDNGSTYWPDVWTAASAVSRNGAFDPTTGCLWRFCNFGSQALTKFDFVNKKVTVFNISSWVSPETSRTIFLDGLHPALESDVIADGSKPMFCWNDVGAGRYRTFGEFSWEHKATWLNPADGKLYVVSPGTGYLWCFETRGTYTNSGDGWKLPFYPVGNRIPLNGAYPALRSFNVYPPVRDASVADVRMNSFMVPFKGGLLWWSSLHHDSGTSGEPHYAFWRRLGYTGDWSVVTMPQEFAANSLAAKNAYSFDNDEVLAISQAYTDIETRQFYRYFWRLT